MISSLLFLVLMNSSGACGMVTRAQVEAATGIGFSAASEEYSKTGSTCTFAEGDAAVTISVMELARPLDLPSELRNLTEAFPGSKVRAVPGFAARAYALEIPGSGTQLHILPAERLYILVSILGIGDGERSFDAAVRVGRAALAKR